MADYHRSATVVHYVQSPISIHCDLAGCAGLDVLFMFVDSSGGFPLNRDINAFEVWWVVLKGFKPSVGFYEGVQCLGYCFWDCTLGDKSTAGTPFFICQRFWFRVVLVRNGERYRTGCW